MSAVVQNIIILIIIAAIIGGAIYYIYKAKKKGAKCIGCPSGGTCGKCTCNSKE